MNGDSHVTIENAWIEILTSVNQYSRFIIEKAWKKIRVSLLERRHGDSQGSFLRIWQEILALWQCMNWGARFIIEKAWIETSCFPQFRMCEWMFFVEKAWIKILIYSMCELRFSLHYLKNVNWNSHGTFEKVQIDVIFWESVNQGSCIPLFRMCESRFSLRYWESVDSRVPHVGIEILTSLLRKRELRFSWPTCVNWDSRFVIERAWI